MAYWIASLLLIAFGILGAFTIGQPFLIVGLAMLVLGPLRHRSLWFWPPMAAVLAYNMAFWVITPLYCSSTSSPGDAPALTSCSSLIGITWPANGGGLADPSAAFAQTNGVALALAVCAFGAVLAWMLRRREAGRNVSTSRPKVDSPPA